MGKESDCETMCAVGQNSKTVMVKLRTSAHLTSVECRVMVEEAERKGGDEMQAEYT